MILTAILIGQHLIQFSSQRGFFWPQAGAGAGTRSQTLCRERESELEASILSLP